jgi:hypothetical protein
MGDVKTYVWHTMELVLEMRAQRERLVHCTPIGFFPPKREQASPRACQLAPNVFPSDRHTSVRFEFSTIVPTYLGVGTDTQTDVI